ncbi:MAG: HU family DNA-binding protein [Steroidobacteraceae bacterium]
MSAPLGFCTTFAYRSFRGRHPLAVNSPAHEVELPPMAKAKKSVKKSTKKPARKAAPKAPQSIKSVLTKSALVAHLADAAKVAAKDVRALLAALEDAIRASIGKRGAGTFMLPGLLKITVTKVPAKPARQGINPFTGQPTTFKAKPATVKVKVRPMKKLKDAAKA